MKSENRLKEELKDQPSLADADLLPELKQLSDQVRSTVNIVWNEH